MNGNVVKLTNNTQYSVSSDTRANEIDEMELYVHIADSINVPPA